MATSRWACSPTATRSFFAKGAGAYIWDVDGRKYLDFMCAYGPSLFGYGRRRDRRRLYPPTSPSATP